MTFDSSRDVHLAILESAPVISQLAQVMHEAGHQLYFVGGCVRDAFLGIQPDDWDLATDATPDQILRANALWADALWDVGRDYGTIAMSKNGIKIEVTTFRREQYSDGDRHPVVTFTHKLESDLSRRDLTINAIAVDALTGEVHDPFDGIKDLTNGVLRTPIDPIKTFNDDPLRMMRLARFQARFPQYRVEIAALNAMDSMSVRILDISKERVLDEFKKMLDLPLGRHKAIRMLDAVGLLHRILPTAQLSLHRWLDDFYGHTLSFPALLSVFFDSPSQVEWACRVELKTRTNEMNDIAKLVTARGTTKDMSATAPDIRRLALKLVTRNGASMIDDFLMLELSNGSLHPDKWIGIRRVRAHMASEGEPVVVSATLSGADVMKLLDLAPSPEVGKALAMALEHRIEHGILWKNEAKRLLWHEWHSTKN